MAKSRCNEQFKQTLHSRLNRLFDSVLYELEGVVTNSYQFQTIRKRILRAGNNALRDLQSEVDYYSLSEDGPSTRTMERMEVDEGEGGR